MKTRSVIVATLFLQAVIVLIGAAALTFLLWEPHLEGRNANATAFEVYFNDPFLAYAYVASSSFFVALCQAFKAIGYVRVDKVFSHAAVRAVRTIRFCAVAIIVFVVFGEAFIVLPNADELPPPIVLGLLIILGSTVTAAVMLVLEHVMQGQVDALSESC